ncbi:MAG: HAD family hydrolase [Pseudomonadota bacterium]
MKKKTQIKCIFVDIGGVLLSKGWGHESRMDAAKKFCVDYDEMESRHCKIFSKYEKGLISLDEYLKAIIFYKKRSFTKGQFKRFILAQSKPVKRMISLMRKLKSKYGLKIVAVNNEGLELNLHRIKKFRLNAFIDFFVSSCFVHLIKPDKNIYKLALDLAQIPAGQVLYIDDQQSLVDIAVSLGIKGICHTDYESTLSKLGRFGLKVV